MAQKEHKYGAAAFRRDLRALLVKHTAGCDIQSDGWPCGTCVASLLTDQMDVNDPQYSERNTPPDRVNEVWRAILQIRDNK